MARMPVEIAAADPRVVRPADLRRRYSQPAKEFGRLRAAGVLLRLTQGHYAVVPEAYRGTAWRPSVEAAGLAIAQVDYGRKEVAAMGITAARLLGAVPRALGAAVIAVPRQRPSIRTAVGRIWFVVRRVERLDVQRVDTEMATGWATSSEQTVLDLADRPDLGGLAGAEVAEAIRQLAPRAEWELIGELAVRQRKRPAAVRAALVAGVEPPVRASRPVHAAGLPLAPDGGGVT
jgi:hypothetical protein